MVEDVFRVWDKEGYICVDFGWGVANSTLSLTLICAIRLPLRIDCHNTNYLESNSYHKSL